MGRSEWGSLERRGDAWDARWRDPLTKKPRRKKVGTVAELGEQIDEATARRLLDELRVQVEGAGGTATFADFLRGYKAVYRAQVAESTVETTYPQMERVAALLGGTPMRAVTLASCEAVLARVAVPHKRAPDGIGKNTLRTLLVRLRAFWSAAQARGVVTANPWQAIKLPREQKRLAEALTPAQVETVATIVPPDLAPLVRFLAETGLRIAEAARLRWTDLDDDHVAVRKSKSEARHVPLTEAARAAIEAIARPKSFRRSPLVFPFLATRGTQAYALRRFHDALEKAGLARMRFHDLRHTLGYRLARAGASNQVIGHVLGISPQTARRYASHHPEEAARHGMGMLERHERAEDSRRKAQ